ncbi:MAG: hypothetical protein HY315_09385 [Acidobacteria bacterium]|nr:hypothetical protein [Acidobacteriota bacterium]
MRRNNLNLRQPARFELFALDQQLNLAPGATRADVLKAMDGHVLGHAVLIGLFHR